MGFRGSTLRSNVAGLSRTLVVVKYLPKLLTVARLLPTHHNIIETHLFVFADM